MTLEQVLAHLGQPQTRSVLTPGWEDSAATDPGAKPLYLQPGWLQPWRIMAGLDQRYEAPLESAAAAMAADPCLRRLLWHGCHQAYRLGEGLYDFHHWPNLDALMPVPGGFFYLIVGLMAVPLSLRRHRAMGLDESFTRAVAADVRLKCERHQIGREQLQGFSPGEIWWLEHHVAGRLFTLGRFAFMLAPYRGQVEFFRNDQAGRLMALARAGTRFTDEGYLDAGLLKSQREGPHASLPGWVATREDDPHTFCGSPLSQEGTARRTPISLPRQAWRRFLSPGDTVLEIHIPSGGGMTPQAAIDSLHQGVAFFRRHFPRQPFSALTCVSWLGSNHLQRMLPPSSNLVRFLREAYLFPVPCSGGEGLHFLFGDQPFNPATALRDTSLRRATLEFLAAGGPWRVGGMVFPVDDLIHWGHARPWSF